MSFYCSWKVFKDVLPPPLFGCICLIHPVPCLLLYVIVWVLVCVYVASFPISPSCSLIQSYGDQLAVPYRLCSTNYRSMNDDASGTGPIRSESVCVFFLLHWSRMSEPFTKCLNTSSLSPCVFKLKKKKSFGKKSLCTELDPFFFRLSIFTYVKKNKSKSYIYQVYVVHFYFYICFF